jgi:hypothetical protein
MIIFVTPDITADDLHIQVTFSIGLRIWDVVCQALMDSEECLKLKGMSKNWNCEHALQDGLQDGHSLGSCFVIS